MPRISEVNEDETESESPMLRSFQIGENDMELPRFTIDGELTFIRRCINSVTAL
jgi:hypothetical protein